MSIQRKGFTLIELLIVVALIGILSMSVMWVYQTSILRAKNGKAQGDLNRIGKAIRQLEVDTELRPTGDSIYLTCGIGNDAPVNIDTSVNIGILQGVSATFPGWNGPYMVDLPNDPWGQPYKYDANYLCVDSGGGVQGLGCENETDGKSIAVIYSMGADKSDGSLNDAALPDNEDNIVLPLCH